MTIKSHTLQKLPENIHSCPNDPNYNNTWKAIVDREMEKNRTEKRKTQQIAL